LRHDLKIDVESEDFPEEAGAPAPFPDLQLRVVPLRGELQDQALTASDDSHIAHHAIVAAI
jgi:hypothetical protein